MSTITDTTYIGMGGSDYATESFDGPVPFERVRDLFASFEATTAPLFTMRDGLPVEVPNRSAIVRDDNGHVLNVTSRAYAIHQFSTVLIDNLLGLTATPSSELEIAGAGLLRQGAVGWVQVQAPSLRIQGDDLAPTITLASSHDGTLATSYRVGMFRFACSNQIGALRSRKGSIYRLKHTRNSTMRLGEARKALGLMFETADDLTAEASRLMSTQVSERDFERVIEVMSPRPAADAAPAAVTRWENRRDTFRNLWTEDERVAPYRGTAWGVMQVFSTWHQWERSMRRTERSSMSRPAYAMSEFLSGRTSRQDRRVHAALAGVLGGE